MPTAARLLCTLWSQGRGTPEDPPGARRLRWQGVRLGERPEAQTQPRRRQDLKKRPTYRNQLRLRKAKPITRLTVNTAGTKRMAALDMGATRPVKPKKPIMAVIASTRKTTKTPCMEPTFRTSLELDLALLNRLLARDGPPVRSHECMNLRPNWAASLRKSYIPNARPVANLHCFTACPHAGPADLERD